MRNRLPLLFCVLALAPLGCGGGGEDSPLYTPAPVQMVTYAPITWSTNATAYRAQVGARFYFECPPGGTPGTVWGSGIYTDDSSICTAAVHAGRTTFANGGRVSIEMRPGQASYNGTAAHGVTSLNYPQWGGSFVFVAVTA